MQKDDPEKADDKKDEDKKSDEKPEDGKKEDSKTEDGETHDKENKDEDKTKDKDNESKDKDDQKDKDEPYKIELPEELAADEGLVEKLEEFVNEHGIPKDKAEAFAQKIIKEQAASIQNVLDTWSNEAKADEEIGGAKFDESVAFAKKAVDRFGGPQLKSALEETGLGSHPEIIKAFCKIGKVMSDDKMFTSGNEKPDKKNGMDTLYPSMVKNET